MKASRLLTGIVRACPPVFVVSLLDVGGASQFCWHGTQGRAIATPQLGAGLA